jgi:YgiT-type zinc finger domain-containing protein
MHVCPNCFIGTLHRKQAAYAAWHGDHFVLMPNSSIWVCDVCGERTYDDSVFETLLPLVGPPTPETSNAARDDAFPYRDPMLSPNHDRRRRA